MYKTSVVNVNLSIKSPRKKSLIEGRDRHTAATPPDRRREGQAALQSGTDNVGTNFQFMSQIQFSLTLLIHSLLFSVLSPVISISNTTLD